MMKKFLAIIAFTLMHFSAQAEIKMIVPFAVGGAFDTVARHFALYIENKTGEPVTVQNVTGAGSQIGTTRLLNSTGRTVLVNSSSFYVNIVAGTFTSDEFKIASILADAPMFLAVPTSKNLTCEKLRTDPRPFFIGSSGKNSITSIPANFVIEKYKNYTEVPYKGIGEAIIDLIGARLDIIFLSTRLDKENPKLQVLANSSLNRYDGLISIKECLGINKGSTSHWVVATNKDASDDFVRYINKLGQDYNADENTKAFFKLKDILPMAGNLATTKKQYDEELKSWYSTLK
jgi:tripartite-type tricarboxylate transporter receptor subunit TctC